VRVVVIDMPFGRKKKPEIKEEKKPEEKKPEEKKK
jgi:hypothetical protein